MERHFIKKDKFNFHYFKIKDSQELDKFINTGGIIESLISKNNSIFAIYIENPNNQTKYVLNEFLITELTKEEYDHLYNITYV